MYVNNVSSLLSNECEFVDMCKHLYHFFSTETICYDDGCHLKRYACNPARSEVTTTANRLASLNYVIDRMHFKGHIDPWCHKHCDPSKLKELENVRVLLCFYIVMPFFFNKLFKIMIKCP